MKREVALALAIVAAGLMTSQKSVNATPQTTLLGGFLQYFVDPEGLRDPDDPGSSGSSDPEPPVDCKQHPESSQCATFARDPFTPSPATDPVIQNEDVIPVNGDSSNPVDEVMEDARADHQPVFLSQLTPRAAFALNSFVAPARSTSTSPARPIVVAVSRGNGLFELRNYSRDGLSPIQLRAWSRRQLLMSPIAPDKQRAFEKQIAAVSKRGSGTHVTHIALNGYCVDAKKEAAPAGRLYIVASAAAREQYAPMRLRRRVADFAASRGFLRPQGDPAAYGRSITQYAIWTKLEHWNETQFTDEFVRRSKDTITSEHKPWTTDTEKTLRALAPHRWKEIDAVIQTADQAEVAARSGSKGGAR